MYSDKDNGNLTMAEKQNGAGTKQEKWVYSWNPRNEMTRESVIPAKAGIQGGEPSQWIPAFAGMTVGCNDATPNATYDYVYVYDAVGNLHVVLNDEGGEEYAFSQDAWGNELSIGSFYGTAWSSARTYGVSEHQTGKWIDPFTGLYFFHHRWYESGVGRFCSRDLERDDLTSRTYVFCNSSTTRYVDPDGKGWVAITNVVGYLLYESYVWVDDARQCTAAQAALTKRQSGWIKTCDYLCQSFNDEKKRGGCVLGCMSKMPNEHELTKKRDEACLNACDNPIPSIPRIQ